MKLPSTQIRINLLRIGKPTRIYPEGLVEDNGTRLRTYSILPADIRGHLSAKFQRRGWIPEGCQIHSVFKFYFYEDYFSLMEFRDQANMLLGYYCDLVTPIQRQGDDYALTDLILDLWVTPEAALQELDRDEFEAAVTAGLISADLELTARRTLSRLKAEHAEGIFPFAYVQ